MRNLTFSSYRNSDRFQIGTMYQKYTTEYRLNLKKILSKKRVRTHADEVLLLFCLYTNIAVNPSKYHSIGFIVFLTNTG